MYILFTYLGKKFLKTIFGIFIVVLFTLIIIDSIDLVKKADNIPLSFMMFLRITLTKMPFIIQETFLSILFIAAVYSFYDISKNNEYPVLRASGLPTWKIVAPHVIIGVILSIFLVTILNPISTVLLNYSDKVERAALQKGQEDSIMSLFDKSVLLINKDNDRNLYYAINATSINVLPDSVELKNPHFIFFDRKYRFEKMVTAGSASLTDDTWVLKDSITELKPKELEYAHQSYTLHNIIKIADLQNSLKKPKYLSLWELPHFMNVLHSIGYSTQVYRTYFYKLLIKPFLIPGIILIAAAIALRPGRNYKVNKMVMISLVTGVFIYFIVETMSNASQVGSVLEEMRNLIGLVMLLAGAGFIAVKKSEVS